MTFTQADLVTLKEALLTGANSVSIAGRSITFRSQDELLKLISTIEAYLEASKPNPVNHNKIKAKFSKY